MSKAMRWWLLPWVALALAGCKREEANPELVLRLGYFPNVTHAQALVGVHDGTFAKAVAPYRLEVKVFSAGPTAMEALAGGELDATYVGTGPALNAFVKGGEQVRLIAPAVNGGAALVTRTARSAEALRGKKIAVPQLGNTQDIALRHWLRAQKLAEKDVEIIPLPNPEAMSMFARGELEGAWVPEPWAARMVVGGGHVLVDERTLWPGGMFHTTVLATTQKVQQAKPDALERLLRAHRELTARWEKDPLAFEAAVNEAFAEAVGGKLPDEVMALAFGALSPARELSLPQLQEAARHAAEIGYLPKKDVSAIVREPQPPPP